LAKSENRATPVWPTIAETHESFDKVANLLLENCESVGVMFATHNEDSVKKIISTMENKNIAKEMVAFGQLLGMCDHVREYFFFFFPFFFFFFF
jgi:hypothetical protein